MRYRGREGPLEEALGEGSGTVTHRLWGKGPAPFGELAVRGGQNRQEVLVKGQGPGQPSWKLPDVLRGPGRQPHTPRKRGGPASAAG